MGSRLKSVLWALLEYVSRTARCSPENSISSLSALREEIASQLGKLKIEAALLEQMVLILNMEKHAGSDPSMSKDAASSARARPDSERVRKRAEKASSTIKSKGEAKNV